MRSCSFVSHLAASLIIAAGLSCMLGCGGFSNGATTPPTKNTYAYVMEESRATGDFSIAQFQVGSDGTFTALNPPTVAAEPYAFYFTADPSGEFFFVNGTENSQTPGTILQLVIGADGTLSPNATASITGSGVGAITFTPNGQFAYSPGSGTDPTLTSYSMDSSGSLHPINTILAAVASNSVTVDATGKFAYGFSGAAVAGGEFTLTDYAIAADGTLRPAMSYPLLNNPSELVVSPQGYLYLTEPMPTTYGGTVPGSIVQFSVSQTDGSLSVVQTYSTADSFPSKVIFNPAGTYAYVNNGYLGTVSQFTVDPSTGALSPNGTPVLGAIATMDPSGNYAYASTWGVNNSWAPQVLRYAIHSDGTLAADGMSTMLDPNSFPQGIVIVQH